MEVYIREDIERITLVPLTLAGKCALMAFEEDAICFSLGLLRAKLMREVLTSKDRCEFLIEICMDYSVAYGLRIDKFLAVDFQDWYEVSGQQLSYMKKELENGIKDENMNFDCMQEITGDDRDKFIYNNLKDAFRFETKRSPGDKSYNPHWTFLLLSQKKRMLQWFPNLLPLYPTDVIRLKEQLNEKPSNVPADFFQESENQQSIRLNNSEYGRNYWSKEDRDLINFVNNNWDDELMGKFTRAVAEKLRIEINKGPNGPTALDGSLQRGLEQIKELIIKIPPKGQPLHKVF